MQQSLAAQSLVDTPLITTSLSMNLAGKIDSITEWTLSVKVLEVGAALRVNSDSGNTVITVPDTSFTILEERAWTQALNVRSMPVSGGLTPAKPG